MRPLVSVNIPTRNSGNTLEACLRSIADQGYPNIETFVIDSESRDQTIAIAKRFHASTYSAESLSEARLEGIRRSNGDYILLLDSDQFLTNNLIEKCVEACESAQFDAITLFERSVLTKHTLAERVMAYDKELIHKGKDDHAYYGAAIPRFFRSETLKKVNLLPGLLTFDHNMLYAATLAMGVRVGFLEAYIHHREPSSWSEIVRKFVRYGYYYRSAFRVDSKLVVYHSMPRRVYFSRRATSNPKLFAGLFILYSLKALASMCGAGLSFLPTLENGSNEATR